jgi:CheY-like chemotaxis protein
VARILVTDDERLARGMIVMLLKSQGHEVLEAMDWPSTLHAVVQHQPDLLILDVTLPGLQGDEIASRLQKAFTGNLPIVLCSGAASVELADLAKEVGTPSYFRKGSSATEVREVVERALKRVPPGPPRSEAFTLPAEVELDTETTGGLLSALKRTAQDDKPGVVIVDDDGPFPRIARAALQAAGYQVRLASNVTEISLGMTLGCRILVLGMDPDRLRDERVRDLVVNYPGVRPQGILWTDRPKLEVPPLLQEFKVTRYVSRSAPMEELVEEVRKAEADLA